MKQNYPRQSEEALIREVIAGDKQAFASLYALHFDALYRFVYSRCGSTQETEDIVSDTWMLIIENVGKYHFKSKFRTFLFGFALNLLRRHYAREQLSELDEDVFISDIEPEELSDNARAGIEKMRHALTQLRPNYQIVLQKRFFEEKSLRETAAQMNLSVQNVKVLQNRAVKKIKQLLT